MCGEEAAVGPELGGEHEPRLPAALVDAGDGGVLDGSDLSLVAVDECPVAEPGVGVGGVRLEGLGDGGGAPLEVRGLPVEAHGAARLGTGEGLRGGPYGQGEHRHGGGADIVADELVAGPFHFGAVGDALVVEHRQRVGELVCLLESG